MNRTIPLRSAIFASLLLILPAFVTSVSAKTILLQNAVVHTVSGTNLANGGVLINGDKIELVFDGPTPKGVVADEVIDLKGQHLYPGLIALDTAVGLSEIEAVRATLDTTEVGEYTPDVQSWVAVNPDSELVPIARANGITHIEPAPQGGVVAGVSGVVALSGWTTEQMTVKRPAALHVYWPSMRLNTSARPRMRDRSAIKSLEEQSREREANLKALDEFFLNARAYAKSRSALLTTGAPDPGINPPWEAMLPVLHGEIPIMVHADDLRQIKAALKWAQTNDYKIIIVGGSDAWLAASQLATQKVPVILESVFEQPNRDYDSYDANFKAAEVLRKAGVTVAFSIGSTSFNAPLTKNLPYLASQAIAFGLPESDALKGITLYPARILGMENRLGSIQPGKEASLFVCDGDIFDLRANVKRLWIAGQEVSLESRHTRLYEKYKNRPLPK